MQEKQAERERVIELHRRGRITPQEADRELDLITDESEQLQRLLKTVDAGVESADLMEEDLRDAALILLRVRDELENIEQTNDIDAKRDVA